MSDRFQIEFALRVLIMALKTVEDVEVWLVENGFEEYTSLFHGKQSQTISYCTRFISIVYCVHLCTLYLVPKRFIKGQVPMF